MLYLFILLIVWLVLCSLLVYVWNKDNLYWPNVDKHHLYSYDALINKPLTVFQNEWPQDLIDIVNKLNERLPYVHLPFAINQTGYLDIIYGFLQHLEDANRARCTDSIGRRIYKIDEYILFQRYIDELKFVKMELKNSSLDIKHMLSKEELIEFLRHYDLL